MAAEDEPPTITQIEILRNEVKDKVGLEAEGSIDRRDLEELMKNDFYVSRFWIHAFFIPGNRIENTVNLIIGTFKWRKEFGVNDITSSDLDTELLKRGALYYHNRDMMGCRLLVFCIRKHSRDAKKVEQMKKMLIYILERLETEENGKRITIIFDSEGAGVANFDLDLVKFLIHVLISYYPNFVNKILVFEMPWILNTAWKVIKALLPPPAVARIKFVSKVSIKSLVSSSQLPVTWGGEDEWEYDWRSLVRQTGGESEGPGCYNISPSSLLKFLPVTHSSHLETSLTLTNTSPAHLALKLKTTEPALFRVRPHIHCLPPSQKVKVVIQTLGSGNNINLINSQQFQVLISRTDQLLDKDNLYTFFTDNSVSKEKVVLSCQAEKVETEVKSVQLVSKVDSLRDRIEALYRVLAVQAALISLLIIYKIFFS